MSEERQRLVLASSSPRRRSLLEQIGIHFEIVPAKVEEDVTKYSTPEEAVQKIAESKAVEVADRFKNHFVLGADTIVVLEENGEEKILGKPKDDEEAKSMLRSLQGREHSVLTGFCITSQNKEYTCSKVVRTKVRFAPISDEEIAAYVSTGEPRDKAGAYGIQGGGAMFVKEVQGSYTNVIGLPLAEVIDELKSCKVWDADCIIPVN